MKLLLATDVTIRGGVDGYVLDLARALRCSGHDVVLLLEETTSSALRDLAPAEGLAVRYARHYHRRYDSDDIRDESARVLADVDPDGLHVICGSPRSCLVLREVAALRGLPMVVTEQAVDDAMSLDQRTREMIHASYLAARAVVFVCQGNRATMGRVIGLDGVRHYVIRNGVNVSRLRATARGAPRRPPGDGARLITAARFAPEKALDILIEAVAVLPEATIGSVSMYGEGPDHDHLRGLVRKLGLESRVFIRPWSGRMAERLAAHDLFVLPSRAEGMSYALLEAMAIGLPVVASDIPGNAEALMYGSAGLLVRQGDATALARGIQQALTCRQEAESRARAAARRVRSHHDLPMVMRETADLWPRVRHAQIPGTAERGGHPAPGEGRDP